MLLIIQRVEQCHLLQVTGQSSKYMPAQCKTRKWRVADAVRDGDEVCFNVMLCT